MFEVRNSDQMTAIEIATSLQNIDLLRSLEVIKRNMIVQHAIAEREAFYPRAANTIDLRNQKRRRNNHLNENEYSFESLGDQLSEGSESDAYRRNQIRQRK